MKDIRTRLKENAIFQESLKPPFPRNMLVELTNACNHKCIFCTNKKKTRNIGYIEEDLLCNLLREAYSLGTRDVGYYTTGEPFMSKNLDRYVAEAKKIGFEYVYITTNGALATPERVRPVIEAGLDSVKFSINAGTPETYKLIHGKDEFHKVISNLKFIAIYRKKYCKPSKIYVSYVVTRQNQNECETLKELVGPLVDDIIFCNVGNQGGMMFEVNASLKVEGGDLVSKPPCNMAFNRFHITWEGYLTLCCVDYQNYLVVADLNKSSLKEAWHNQLFVDLRRRHLTNKLKGTLCYNCLYNKNEKVAPLISQYATIWTDPYGGPWGI